jgi:hypothetical protein
MQVVQPEASGRAIAMVSWRDGFVKAFVEARSGVLALLPIRDIILDCNAAPERRVGRAHSVPSQTPPAV